MFRTKICGVTTPEDALMVAELGVDAIGLNFYKKSKRYVSADRGAEITAALPAGVIKVGVFVNSSASAIRQVAETAKLDVIQLHGDEPPTFLGELSDFLLLRAFRTEGSLQAVKDYLSDAPKSPQAVLLDAYDPHEYGGTGKTLYWPDLADAGLDICDAGGAVLPLILAGGLNPANVAQAISEAQPHGVDVASGVESEPGKKCRKLCEAFLNSAKSAFPA